MDKRLKGLFNSIFYRSRILGMSEQTLKIEMEPGVATVVLNRPDARNAFDEQMIADLDAAFADLGTRADVKAVVLRGAGKSFSAGADLNWMQRAAGYSEAQNKADAETLAAMLNRLYTLPKLTVACVQGAAMGGGLGLVACCDVVLAEFDAIFSLSEVKLGLIPATIAPYVLRAMGERHFRRFAQTGERFDGRKAYDIGLAHEIAERPDEIEFLLHTLLEQVKGNGPAAMAASKRLALDLTFRPIDAALMTDTAQRIAQTRAGAEAKEGLAAFMEKRKAAWVKG
jgi:methylglutaconyl-CoA hydratase